MEWITQDGEVLDFHEVERIPTICTISISPNDVKYIYSFMFLPMIQHVRHWLLCENLVKGMPSDAAINLGIYLKCKLFVSYKNSISKNTCKFISSACSYAMECNTLVVVINPHYIYILKGFCAFSTAIFSSMKIWFKIIHADGFWSVTHRTGLI